MIDLAAVRADTPGCHRGVFLDSAGSSLPPVQVLDEVIGHLRREAEIGGYRGVEERRRTWRPATAVLASLLGCEPDEVAFTDSATRVVAGRVRRGAAGGGRPGAGAPRWSTRATRSRCCAARRRSARPCRRSRPTPDGRGRRGRAARDAGRAGAAGVAGARADERRPGEPGGAGRRGRARGRARWCCWTRASRPARCRSTWRRSASDMVVGHRPQVAARPAGTGFLVVRREVLPRLRPRQVDLRSGTWSAPQTVRAAPGRAGVRAVGVQRRGPAGPASPRPGTRWPLGST